MTAFVHPFAVPISQDLRAARRLRKTADCSVPLPQHAITACAGSSSDG